MLVHGGVVSSVPPVIGTICTGAPPLGGVIAAGCHNEGGVIKGRRSLRNECEQTRPDYRECDNEEVC